MLGLTRRFLLGAIAIATMILAQPALAEDGHPYFGPEAVDLTVPLVPPPAKESDVTKAELAEVKALQATVTDARKQQAIADAEEGFAPFVATTSLASLDPAKLPLTVALVQRVLDTEDAVTGPAKKFFDRPRPPLVNGSIKALATMSKSNAYPSGRTTNGTATTIVLSEMVPEKRAELMARAEDYATSRLIVGVHYRSDLGAGFASGALIAKELQENADFQKEMVPAKAELRAALGLQQHCATKVPLPRPELHPAAEWQPHIDAGQANLFDRSPSSENAGQVMRVRKQRLFHDDPFLPLRR